MGDEGFTTQISAKLGDKTFLAQNLVMIMTLLFSVIGLRARELGNSRTRMHDGAAYPTGATGV